MTDNLLFKRLSLILHSNNNLLYALPYHTQIRVYKLTEETVEFRALVGIHYILPINQLELRYDENSNKTYVKW